MVLRVQEKEGALCPNERNPRSSPSSSAIGSCNEKMPSRNQERGPSQTLNPPVPWSWTSQPLLFKPSGLGYFLWRKPERRHFGFCLCVWKILRWFCFLASVLSRRMSWSQPVCIIVTECRAVDPSLLLVLVRLSRPSRRAAWPNREHQASSWMSETALPFLGT